MPFTTFEGRVNSILFECIPGGGLDRIVDMRYDDDPHAFEATVLDLLQEHAPAIYERVDRRAFRLTRPQDVLQGAITPMVRHGYTRLAGGRFAVAIGDVRAVVDPIVGQGANTASQSAWLPGTRSSAGGPFDEAFCSGVEARIWEYARRRIEWTNATLHPPAQHAMDVFMAAAQNQAIADEIARQFNAPARNWAIFESPEGAQAFLDRASKSSAKVVLGLTPVLDRLQTKSTMRPTRLCQEEPLSHARGRGWGRGSRAMRSLRLPVWACISTAWPGPASPATALPARQGPP